MKLFICEKPSQARDIGKVIGATKKNNGHLSGADVCVTWGFGHLLATAAPEDYDKALSKWTLEALPIIPGEWRSVVPKDKSKQLKVIGDLIKKADSVVIATDADREGEAIAREILDRFKWKGKTERLWLSALDESSIRAALANILPGEKTESLYMAALGRARADWLVGMNLTRAYTVASGRSGVLSVGRVQTPTLKLVVDRDRKIENFTPQDYYTLIATVEAEGGQFTAKWQPPESITSPEGLVLDPVLVEHAEIRIQGRAGVITACETQRKKKAAPLPFDLSTLQRELSRRYGTGAKRTLEIAQALYEEHKATTYPRTDCRFLPESQFGEAAQIVAALSKGDPAFSGIIGKADLSIRSKVWNDKKITAHHAIIPNAAHVDTSKMSTEERQAYTLIVQHYLLQFFPPYEYDSTRIEMTIGDETLIATGNTPVIMGFKDAQKDEAEAEGDDESENARLPAVSEGAAVVAVETERKAAKTKPPARFTEGTLIEAMISIGKQITDSRYKKILKETSGIGTEATRANIIDTLLKRGFIASEGKKAVVSSDVGRALVDALPREVTDPITTAIWEQALDDIAEGKRTLDSFLEKQRAWIEAMIANIKKNRGAMKGLEAETHPCPDCGKPMNRRKSSSGFFWGCTGYPECKTTMDDKKGKPTKRKQTGKKKRRA